RKGSGYGRIYRILPKDEPVREIPDLAKVAPKNLVRYLASPNGIVRDLAHRLLVERKAVSVTGQVSKMALKHPSPRARLHALCVLDGINRLTLEILYSACKDPHPQLRRHAVRLAEYRWAKEPELVVAVSEMIDDVDLGVRLQVACSLGNSKRPEAGHALAALAVDNAADPMIRAAVMSSPPHHFIALAERALDQGVLVDELIKVAGAKNHAALEALVTRLSQPGKEGFQPVQFQSLSHWADLHPQASVRLSHVIGEARKIVRMPGGSSPLKIAAISLLGIVVIPKFPIRSVCKTRFSVGFL
ncbi:HEAT repeat domain-containing protein, partial [Akkermansiaceae bacterium]|nr:HEAT repeat domain-containing protein [Akkermansiaceae bacterium]